MKLNLYSLKRRIRFIWQKLTRGFSDDDTWSLDWKIAQYVLPRLKRFKELNNGFPNGTTEEGWDEKLSDMIYAMEIYANGHWNAEEDTDWKRVKRGQELFGKHFSDLWW